MGPAGMMMLNYVVWGSIQDHEASQAYLWESKRAKGLTVNMQIIGIVITIIANLWNASLDKTIIRWSKKKCPVCWSKMEECFAQFDQDSPADRSVTGDLNKSYPQHALQSPV